MVTISMWQEKGQSALQSPLGLRRALVGVNHDLSRVVEIAKL